MTNRSDETRNGVRAASASIVTPTGANGVAAPVDFDRIDRELAEDARRAAARDRACVNRIRGVAADVLHDGLGLLDLCESPIEQLFVTAAMVIGWRRRCGRLAEPAPGGARAWLTKDRLMLFLQQPLQHSGKNIRVDFMFVAPATNGKWRKLVVEVDGHEWHERTKDQATRDKRRDRDLLARGFPVMRFTGSEVYDEPYRCVCEAEAHIKSSSSAQ